MNAYPVAILGCGPAGLLAAHAAVQTGYRPVIFSVKRPSVIGGAQFLHIPVEGVTREEPDAVVQFVKDGWQPFYANKIYGDPGAPTSWNAYHGGEHRVWNMQAAYHRLWQLYGHLIVDRQVNMAFLSQLLEQQKFKAIISSIPLRAICYHHHEFRAEYVYIVNGVNVGDVPDNTIIYGGRPSYPWYRQSHLFGHRSIEFPRSHQPPGGTKVYKPLSHDCTCWDGHITRVGRYGQWTKGVLIHNAYEDARDVLLKL